MPRSVVELVRDFERAVNEYAFIGGRHIEEHPAIMEDYREAKGALITKLMTLQETARLYHELLYQVHIKHPNETRHETALRYIINAERQPVGADRLNPQANGNTDATSN